MAYIKVDIDDIIDELDNDDLIDELKKRTLDVYDFVYPENVETTAERWKFDYFMRHFSDIDIEDLEGIMKLK